MDKRSVYLDHQTTTPVLEEALQAMLPYFREAYGSPSSLHRYGLQVREGLKEAKEQLARMINAESWEDLIITSGGTESSNPARSRVSPTRMSARRAIISSSRPSSIPRS